MSVHALLSLRAVLPTLPTSKAHPPATLQSRGLIAVPPSFQTEHQLALLTPALLQVSSSSSSSTTSSSSSSGGDVVAAFLFPLHGIPDGFVAVDHHTLASLRLNHLHLSLPPNRSSSNTKPSSAKSSTPRARRSRTSSGKKNRPSFSTTPPASPSQPQPPPPQQAKPKRAVVSVLLTPLPNLVPPSATRVFCHVFHNNDDEDDDDVSADVVTRLFSSVDDNNDALSTSLSQALCARLVLPGHRLQTTLLGHSVTLVVDAITTKTTTTCGNKHINCNVPLTPALLTKHTVFSITPEPVTNRNNIDDDNLSSTAALLLDSLGGLSDETERLRKLIHTRLLKPSDEQEGEEGEDVKVKRTSSSKGAILHGPAGVGKTVLAQAMAQWYATHHGVHVQTLSCGILACNDSASQAVKQLHGVFRQAHRRQPSIVILDDISCAAPRRNASSISSNPSRLRLVATLLSLLDGADPNAGAEEDGGGEGGEGEGEGRVFVVGTCGNLDEVDSAVRRAGRLDEMIQVQTPDVEGRLEILQKVSRKGRQHGLTNVTEEELRSVAERTYGFVGADLSALWSEAASRAVRRCTTRRALGCGEEKEEEAAVVVVEMGDLMDGMRRVGAPSALRTMQVEVPTTRWTDVGGMCSAKRMLRKAVEWPLDMKNRRLLDHLNIRAPRGVLLYGPPGCSKTLLARAVATECQANFVSVNGAELLSKWVGESEKAVRQVFVKARLSAPCIVFLDEVDALACSRGPSTGGAQSRVVAQLLHELDGMDHHHDVNDTGVVILAATNRPWDLDVAFLRAGRMDIHILVDLPDPQARKQIFQVHTRRMPLCPDVSLTHLSTDAFTSGFSGAECAALVREAALSAMQRDLQRACQVSWSDFQNALRLVKPRTDLNSLQALRSFSAH